MWKERNRKVSAIPTGMQETSFAARLFIHPLSLFPILPCPLCYVSWGAGSTSALCFGHCRLGSKPSLTCVQGCTMRKDKRKSATLWLILLLIWNLWYCTSGSDNRIPYTQACFPLQPTSLVLLTWARAKIERNGNFTLLWFVAYVPHCGWHFPPLLSFFSSAERSYLRGR